MSEAAMAAARRARAIFLGAWTLLLCLRLVFAAELDLFVDEAYYAWQAERLAFAFSDLPPGTAVLAALGRQLAPSSAFTLRLSFLLLGALLPWLVVRWARRFGDERAAWHAGTAALLLPLYLPVATLALPEAPLAVLWLMVALLLTRALERSALRDWLALGLFFALGFQTHHRFAIAAGGLALALLWHPRGRAALSGRGPWLAAGIAVASLLPAWAFEAEVLSASLLFQFADRHPWRFGAEGLLHVPLQAVVSTPLLWLLVWVGVLRRLRALSADPAGVAVLGLGVFPSLLFALLAPFADQMRTSVHWPFAPFLVLLPFGFSDWGRQPRSLRRASMGLLTLGTMVAIAYLAAAARPQLASPLSAHKAYPEGFTGWRELSAAVAARVDSEPVRAIVADNVLLAAQLAFALPKPALYVLDHPRNRFHGRAVQLARWMVDEHAFRRAQPFPALLVVEDEATPLKDRLAHYRSLCAKAASVRWSGELALYGGRRRFLFFRLDAGERDCRLPPLAYIDRIAVRGDPPQLLVEGWAIQEFSGVAAVGLLLDGVERARAAVDREAAKVQAQWPFSQDPKHPRVGFQLVVELRPGEPKPRRVGLRLYGADGSTRDFPEHAWPSGA